MAAKPRVLPRVSFVIVPGAGAVPKATADTLVRQVSQGVITLAEARQRAAQLLRK